jgi:hypothetical protein
LVAKKSVELHTGKTATATLRSSKGTQLVCITSVKPNVGKPSEIEVEGEATPKSPFAVEAQPKRVSIPFVSDPQDGGRNGRSADKGIGSVLGASECVHKLMKIVIADEKS